QGASLLELRRRLCRVAPSVALGGLCFAHAIAQEVVPRHAPCSAEMLPPRTSQCSAHWRLAPLVAHFQGCRHVDLVTWHTRGHNQTCNGTRRQQGVVMAKVCTMAPKHGTVPASEDQDLSGKMAWCRLDKRQVRAKDLTTRRLGVGLIRCGKKVPSGHGIDVQDEACTLRTGTTKAASHGAFIPRHGKASQWVVDSDSATEAGRRTRLACDGKVGELGVQDWHQKWEIGTKGRPSAHACLARTRSWHMAQWLGSLLDLGKTSLLAKGSESSLVTTGIIARQFGESKNTSSRLIGRKLDHRGRRFQLVAKCHGSMTLSTIAASEGQGLDGKTVWRGIEKVLANQWHEGMALIRNMVASGSSAVTVRLRQVDAQGWNAIARRDGLARRLGTKYGRLVPRAGPACRVS
ncbi:hypothetical protein HAX54_050521, partial [Datura stramonium]|nr:hypothetical protein [Datura stramonium]